MTDLLMVERVSKRFGGLWAVRDCSFGVPQGGLIGLIGPNGAGKSTLFNVISGILTPESGHIRLDGEDITGRQADEVARADIGRTFQAPRAFLSLTVLDNVVASAPSPGEHLWTALTGRYQRAEAQLRERALAFLDLVGLEERADDLSAELSGGELRMLEVARQLIREPRLLLLDEPTAGVSPALQETLAGVLGELHRKGMTLLVVEHNLTFLLSLAQRVVVLDHGSVLAEGTPAEIRSDERVVAAYLGRAHAS
jgi:ABC-type branched-subunit amino acid transport system ATPase component